MQNKQSFSSNKQSLLLRNQIPKNWQKVKFGSIASFRTGKLDSNAAVQSGKYPFFTCSQETYKTNTYSFDTECVLLGGNNANGIYPLKYYKGKFDAYQRTYVIESLNNFVLLNRFLYYVLHQKLDFFRILSTGAATKFLTLSILQNIEIGLPDVSTQGKITSILSAFDDKIEVNNKIAKTLEEMAQALFKEWFVHFRFPGYKKGKMVDSPLGKIPEGWGIKKIKDFGLVVTGKTPSKEKSEYYGDYMPFIKTPDMHGNIFCIKAGESLSEVGTNLQKNKILPANSICVSCIGTAGVVTITTQASQTNQQINSIVLKDQVDREFLFFILRGLENTINMYGANGATMVNLNKSKFESLQIIYPSADLVNSFHTIVYPMFELIKNLQFKNNSLYQTRDLLLPKLMRGEIRV